GSHVERKTTRFSIAPSTDCLPPRAAAATGRRLRRPRRNHGLALRKRSSCSLPRLTASSSACLAVFCPLHTASSSSSLMLRICTKLPSRKPLEFAVGGLLVSSLIAISVPGFLS